VNLAVKNILANYGSRLIGLLSLYLFTPFYIRLLGVESYGVISFYTLLYGLATFADAGITSAMDREFAKSTSDEYKLSLLRLFEKIYLAICMFICLVVLLEARNIAQKWLNADTIALSDLTIYTRLIGVGVALQLMPMVYIGAMMGLQKQVRVNLILTCWSILKAIGAITAMTLISANLSIFFTWQIICNVLFIFIARQGLFTSLNNNSTVRLSFSQVPKEIWKYIGGMFFISVLNAVNIQLDKIVTSKLFALEKFGYYSLMSLLAQIPLLIATPIVLAIFPSFNQKISDKRKFELKELFLNYSILISTLIFPVCFVTVLYGSDIFTFIFRKEILSPSLLVAIRFGLGFMISANTFLALQQILFYFLLAEGKTRYSIIQGVVQIALMVPGLFIFIRWYDLAGVGIPLFFINLIGFCFLLIVVTRRFLTQSVWPYLAKVLLIPMCTAAGASVFVYILSKATVYANNGVLLAVITFLLSCIINLLIYSTIFNIRVEKIDKGSGCL